MSVPMWMYVACGLGILLLSFEATQHVQCTISWHENVGVRVAKSTHTMPGTNTHAAHACAASGLPRD